MAVVDFPAVKIGKAGNLFIERAPKGGNECAWTMELVNGYDGWRDLIGLPPAVRIEVEKAITPSGRKIVGACRADCIFWHDERTCSILEAKTDCAPGSIAGAIGQLLYYRALVSAYWQADVISLILAAPQLPPFILEAIAEAKAPISFLKRDANDNLTALVPAYGNAANA